MKKLSYEYILYYVQITFIGVFVLVLLAYSLDMAEKDFLERKMYTENVAGIQLSSEYLKDVSDEEVNLQLSEIESSEDFMIYKRLSEDDDEIIRGGYGTGDIFDFTGYIEEGRFFESSDYENETLSAVIGADALVQTFVEDGVRYYGYNQQLYEVVGIFRQTGTVLDCTIYLNLTSLLKEVDHYGLYYVDAKNQAVVDGILSSIEANADGQYSTMKVAYESPVSYGLGGDEQHFTCVCSSGSNI